ncbi:uncharacterized protein Triagg1_8400 [Trichoderma aggressivum f. europaeum]|uniref:Enoyl reductase (ER) domain-containing protein n=1 Tax=Trichoderma aggressivum f. europaeum TaxID=173218 RepID=A0AAE1I9Y9_9HYPO|nr:hypothetical protein Triagg1_8400 [Trichoderma aggressivum f. europaeum]
MPPADTTGQLPQHQAAITATVAINPVDVKSLDYSPAPGAIIGFDFAGTIVALGVDAAKEGRLAVGDRVAKVVYGMDRLQPDGGAFAQYVGALADLVLKLPDHISLEDATALGLATATLFKEMELPGALDRLSVPVSDRGNFVLVAGGSTATGTRAIELPKTQPTDAGFRPIATSSPSNFELVKKFGAEAVFDYHDPGCADAIRAYTNNELDYVLDCIAEAETTQLCYAAISRASGQYVAVEPFRESIAQSRINTVNASWFNVMTVWGRKVELGGEYACEASLEDREFGARSFAAVQTLLDRGFVTTHPIKIMSGGWEGVVEGVANIRSQPPSGYK